MAQRSTVYMIPLRLVPEMTMALPLTGRLGREVAASAPIALVSINLRKRRFDTVLRLRRARCRQGGILAWMLLQLLLLLL